mmetsp:Transcript_1374/g.2125  ORF Transcript_1374/g.2125 Transcript_1374/m.2125 type:complete len:170 (-) Transcript_1374:43-552(-)
MAGGRPLGDQRREGGNLRPRIVDRPGAERRIARSRSRGRVDLHPREEAGRRPWGAVGRREPIDCQKDQCTANAQASFKAGVAMIAKRAILDQVQKAKDSLQVKHDELRRVYDKKMRTLSEQAAQLARAEAMLKGERQELEAERSRFIEEVLHQPASDTRVAVTPARKAA